MKLKNLIIMWKRFHFFRTGYLIPLPAPAAWLRPRAAGPPLPYAGAPCPRPATDAAAPARPPKAAAIGLTVVFLACCAAFAIFWVLSFRAFKF